MKTFPACFAFLLTLSPIAFTQNEALAWPAITREAKPWTYWWWMGSAVDPANLTRELQRFHDAGLGGVHIIPIYGAKGFEDRFIDYLSPKWMEMLRHTMTEANRLGLGVDMTTGTGWCLGGPDVSDRDANALAVVKTFDVGDGARLSEKFSRETTQALVAFSADGKALGLTDKIDASGGVEWTASGGAARVFAVSQKPSGQKVKRAAPGGAGHMLNPLFPEAMTRHLQKFTSAFAAYDGPKPRAMYHDSYEYRSEWAPDFLAQFEQRRGYRLQTELPALFGKEEDDRAARVKGDFRETMSDLLIEASLPIWTGWSRDRGFLTRNEAHGSPGNLLDLYAFADIPETEMFHLDRNPLVAKLASSAAHVTGQNLVSAETGTWLKEHFTETPGDLKGLVDELFTTGVNHVFFHGSCYSPEEAPWPGWVFYASTEMNSRNAIWRDLPALAGYIARCQAALQAGKSDNDVLLYWPIHDTWHDAKGMAKPLTVHARAWLEDMPFGKVAERLWKRGYTFDYVSNRQLADSRVLAGKIVTKGSAYRAIVVPACEHLPLATLEKLRALAAAGATVIFDGAVPKDVPGWSDLEMRRAQFQKLVAGVQAGEVEADLKRAGVRRETLADHPGLLFIRRAIDGGRIYFLANRGAEVIEDWLPLASAFTSAQLLNPMNGQTGIAARRADGEVFVQLQPGESVLVRTFIHRKIDGPAWPCFQTHGAPIELTGTWQVKFLEGGPELPKPFETAQLTSWTTLAGDEGQRFAGTALYTLTFDAPASDPHWQLDLGQVAHSARVCLNGRDLGPLLLPPFRVAIEQLKPRGNVLEIEVTSTSANRIRDLDRRGVKWQNFYDINFVNIDYKPFNAAAWPLADAGLLGPVRLIPTRAFTPQ